NAFEDSIAALQLADQNLFGGANQALIQSCALARGLIPLPKVATPTLTSPVGGEVFPPGSTVNITWNTGGAPAGATYTLEYSANCGNRSFFDNVERGVNGWTTSHLTTTLDWTRVTSDSFSPTHSWFAGDEGEINDQYLVSPQFTVASGAELSF